MEGEARSLSRYAYIVGVDLHINGSNESIDPITGNAVISDYGQCTDTLNFSVCSLRSAIGEYDVVRLHEQTLCLDHGCIFDGRLGWDANITLGYQP